MIDLDSPEFRDYLATVIYEGELEKRDNLIEEKYGFIECIVNLIGEKDNLIKNTGDSTIKSSLIEEKDSLIMKKNILLMKVDVLIKENDILNILMDNNFTDDEDLIEANTVLSDKKDMLPVKMGILMGKINSLIENRDNLVEKMDNLIEEKDNEIAYLNELLDKKVSK